MTNRLPDKYAAFIQTKQQHGSATGFSVDSLPSFLYDFQSALVSWALWQGRSAMLADCGLGKTPMQLAWANEILKRLNRSVLVLSPLAVGPQTVREAHKFGIDAVRSRDGRWTGGTRIVVTNYQRLHYFRPADFAAVVCDESSILKSFNGQTKAAITEFMREVPYRLLCTATAAPNDYTELGTSSEALGELGYMDMLNRFFRNDQNTSDTKGRLYGSGRGWRFKGHAEDAFWKWVCSWARACRKPSDLGFADDDFVLPKLTEREHIVETRTLADGMLFALPARNMREEREERRRTIAERCELAAELAMSRPEASVTWRHLNKEGDLLGRLIDGARQIAGSTPDEEKEELYEAFSSGQLRHLITKPKIGAWGLNWQHCWRVLTFASHSWEKYYQSVRRCWRFGQEHEVVVDLIATEGERGIKDNMLRKAAAAEKMFDRLVAHMNDAIRINPLKSYTKSVEVPPWL